MEVSPDAAVIWGALVMGGVCGLLPLLVGVARKKVGLAMTGFIACVVGGFMFGIVAALPLAIIFTVIIALSNSEISSTSDRHVHSSNESSMRPTAAEISHRIQLRQKKHDSRPETEMEEFERKYAAGEAAAAKRDRER